MLTLCFPEWLQRVEDGILLSVNGLHTPWLDVFMQVCSDRLIWLPLYAAMLWLFVVRQGARFTLLTMALVALVIFISDQTAVHVVRGIIPRMRPSNPQNPIEPMVHLVDGYRSGRHGFPSAHASNVVAFAAYCAWVFRNRLLTWLLVTWVLLVCYSRMYLGVHYLGDILGGALLGFCVATVVYLLQRLVLTRSVRLKADRAEVAVVAVSMLLSLAISGSLAAMKVAMT